MVVYLDDLLIMSESEAQSLRDRDTVLKLLEEFGLGVNRQKSHLTPTQQIQYLGVVIDSREMTMTLPAKRKGAIVSLANQMLAMSNRSKAIGLPLLRKLVGTLQATADCVLETRLRLNSIIEALREAENNSTHCARLSPLAVEDLQWWRTVIPTLPGRRIHAPLPDHVIDTDASHHGWGAVYVPRKGPRITVECQGFFNVEMTSNARELTAIAHAVESLTRRFDWKGCAVRVRTDNQTAMTYTNKMGGREPELSRIAEKMHHMCIERKITLTAEYLPGEDNTEADRLSRIEADLSQSRLHPDLFRRCEEKLGPFTLDAFASAANAQLPRYVSYRTDTKCEYSDFLSRPVPPEEKVWCFPPFSLIGRILAKVLRESATLTLALPLWPAQPWWPVCLSLATRWPLLLPPHARTLETPSEKGWQPHRPAWSFLVLTISGQPSERKAFRTTLSNLCSERTKEESLAQLSEAMKATSGLTLAELPPAEKIHSICQPLLSLT